MSLMSFLYAVEAVRAEEGVRFHVETEKPEPSPVDNRERNAQAMAAFAGMMAGTQKRGGRR